MRKSPLITAIGGGALALGLVTAGATAATADDPEAQTASTTSSSNDTASTQLEALQRDLDLSETEATELLDQQAKAADIEDKLRSSLGDTFGGSHFDTKSGELTVSVTEKSAADDVRKAGAEPRVVTYGQDRLEAMADKLDAQKAGSDAGIASWGPDASEDAVVITAVKGKEQAAKDVAKDAGIPADAVQIEQTSEQPRPFADIVGGEAYMIDGSGRCSIGFATESGFVTAGHCGEAGTPVSSQDGSGTGEVTDAVFPGSDMGVVTADSNWTPTPTVTGESGPVTVAGSQEATEGAAVCRSGSTTGWHCGEIQSKNQSVSYPQGTVDGLTQTNVCAEPGDSGGSWLSDDQAQGVTSGGSGNCSSGGTTFFQPVNPILEQFGVTLLTG